jgi:hypothetical protein
MSETIISNMINENKRLHSQLLEAYENNIINLRKQNDTFNEIIKLMNDKFNNETGKLKLKILELGKEIIDKNQLISEMTDSLYSEALYYDTLEDDKNY